MTPDRDRESLRQPSNPLGLDGIEFVEYTTSRPQALGQVLELMGFRPVARHRSREVLRYRQGSMNVIVNAHGASAGGKGGALASGMAGGTASAMAGSTAGGDDDSRPVAPELAAVALRVRDAGAAWRRAIERGAWAVPVSVEPMELNIPGIHGVGGSRLYFVDRYREFSIYDVDFVPIPTVDANPPALAGLHWFGLVQYIGLERMDDWIEFYREILGFSLLDDERRFGILPKGRILASPCGQFYWQLIEPEGGLMYMEGDERLQRLGLGTPDVPAAVAALRSRGIEFMEAEAVHTEARGAVTRGYLGGLMFELVRNGSSGPAP